MLSLTGVLSLQDKQSDPNQAVGLAQVATGTPPLTRLGSTLFIFLGSTLNEAPSSLNQSNRKQNSDSMPGHLSLFAQHRLPPRVTDIGEPEVSLSKSHLSENHLGACFRNTFFCYYQQFPGSHSPSLKEKRSLRNTPVCC